jgi:hypothetical protein
MEILDLLLSASFWAAAIRIASPLIFATMGELICERAGVLNLGIEGIMVVGAFAGWMAVYSGTGLWTGVAMALLAGMLFGLLHATLTVPLGLSQHVVGLGITLLWPPRSPISPTASRCPASPRRRGSRRSSRCRSPSCPRSPCSAPRSSPRRRSPISPSPPSPWSPSC